MVQAKEIFDLYFAADFNKRKKKGGGTFSKQRFFKIIDKNLKSQYDLDDNYVEEFKKLFTIAKLDDVSLIFGFRIISVYFL